MFRYIVSRICTYLDGWRLQELGLRRRFPVVPNISRLSDDYTISRGLNLSIFSYTYKTHDTCRLQFVEGGDVQGPSLKLEL